MIKISRFLPVLCYYSGFTKLADPAIRELIHAYSQQKSDLSDLLPLLHCLFEAQQPSLCLLAMVKSHFDYIDGSYCLSSTSDSTYSIHKQLTYTYIL